MNQLLAALCAASILSFSSAHADPKGEAVLRQAFKKLGSAKSMSAELTVAISSPGAQEFVLKGTVSAMKPNLLLVDLRAAKQDSVRLFFSAGASEYVYNYNSPPGTYRKEPNQPLPTEFIGVWEGEVDGFFGGEGNLGKVKATYVGTGVVDGVQCDIVKADMQTPPRSVSYHIGKGDHIIRRSTLTFGRGSGQRGTQTNTVKNVKLGVELKADALRFTVPSNLKLFSPMPQQSTGGKIL